MKRKRERERKRERTRYLREVVIATT